FSFTVSHDLRSPLRAMQGFAHAVLEEYGNKLDARGRDYLERVSKAAVHLDKLILEVLAYTRAGGVAPTIESVDLNELVEEVIQTYDSLRTADITLQHPLHPVLGSQASLVLCISNLLANAVKFVPPGARAKVRV